MTPRQRSTVLVVDDDAAVRALLAEFLAAEGYVVVQASHVSGAIAALGQDRAAGRAIGLVLLDLVLPGGGLNLLRDLARAAAPPVVAMSANIAQLRAASASGAAGVLLKPFDLDQVLVIAARYCGVPQG
jgi:two-component system OmpR family response regulator